MKCLSDGFIFNIRVLVRILILLLVLVFVASRKVSHVHRT